MKIPFTNYDIHLSKRGISFVREGQLVGFTDWLHGAVYTNTTPIMEEIYSTVASEFAKIDLMHVTVKDGNYTLNRNTELNYVVSERPNKLQTKFDFLFTMMYQLFKYGNAFAYLHRDKQGNVYEIEPLNAEDYLLGNGYQIDDYTTLIKFKNKKTNMIELVEYKNLIHLRFNPNDIFFGDMFSGFSFNKVMIDLVDAGLSSLVRELKENGTVRGIIQIGGAATGYARGVATRVLAGQEEKITKQEEIIERIKKTRGGILVLDAGEEWRSLGNPFETTSTKEIDKYIDILLQFNGINRKVIDGTANADAMEVFFQKIIRPRIEQFVSEANYKIFSKTALTRGNRIEYYRNPFEYVPIDRAIDVAYKAKADLTTNEIRNMLYKLPSIEGGDKLMYNKNFDYIYKGSNDSDANRVYTLTAEDKPSEEGDENE